MKKVTKKVFESFTYKDKMQYLITRREKIPEYIIYNLATELNYAEMVGFRSWVIAMGYSYFFEELSTGERFLHTADFIKTGYNLVFQF